MAFHIDLFLSTHVARELDTLEAICEVSTNDTKQNYQIVWFKILPDSIDDEVEIATNDFVNKEFKDTGRYEARLEVVRPEDFTNVRFFLTISKLQSEDSGYLGCRIGLPLVTIERFKLFTVQVPVHSVWWSSTPPDSFFPIPIHFRADENISWTEGESVQLTCHCIGGYPRPDVEIALGAEDMTHRFTRSDELVRGGGGGGDGRQTGLQSIHYSVELSNRGVVAEYRYDAKLLKCRARLPGIDENKSALLNIRIAEYRPKFFCTRQMTTRLGQENFNLTCLVKAEPEIRNTTVFRYDRHPFDNRSLPLNETDAFQFYSETISEDEVLLVLRISRVSSEHLGSYVFVATNDLGSERHKVELHKGNCLFITSSKT